MDADDAKKAQLVEAIAEDRRVKAAALLDEDGKLRRLEGSARVFRDGLSGSQTDGGDEHEDVFLEAVGRDYLVVVFPPHQEFEPIQQEVDRLLERLGL